MSENSDNRPAWPFKMTEADFRKTTSIGMIVSVAARWEYTSADTSREWLEVQSKGGDKAVMPHGWREVWDFAGLSHVPGLFKLTYEGERMRKQMEEIDKWEKKNADDRAAYERLRRKFDGADKPQPG